MRTHSSVKCALVFGLLALSLAACKSSEGSDDGADTTGQSGEPSTRADAGSASPGGPIGPPSGGELDAGSSPSGSGAADAASGSRGESRKKPMQDCPAEVFFGVAPQNGTPCMDGRGACRIGAATCECPKDTLKWVCWNDMQCPEQPPAERASCPLVDMQCDYIFGEDEVECECTAAGWDCGRQVCPATEPAAGGACEGGDGVCTFGGRVCDCRSKAWICWNASDCPAAPPALNAACPVQRMVCEYPNDECQCKASGWECDSHEDSEDSEDSDDETAPASDAGVAADASAPVSSGASDAG